MDDTTQRVWLNGEIGPAVEARVSALDAALLHGVGLFETLRAYHGRIFRLRAHLERMRRSAEALKFPLSDDVYAQCEASLPAVLAANGLADARLRLTVTGGTTLQPGERADTPRPTVLATATAVAAYPREYYEKGMTVLISPYRQSRSNPLAGHKTTCYWPRLTALREAHAAQCGEALWFTDKHLLAEGCVSNVFVVRDGVLKTPPLDTPVLRGTVRDVVLEAALTSGRSVQELPLTVNDLLDADEVFLTNSVMEVMPVCRVERKPIGDEKPGAITQWAATAYRQVVAAECGPEAA